MSTFSKSILAVVIAAVAAGGIYGGYKFLLSKPQITLGSPAGSTFNTAKFAGVVANLAVTTSVGTTTSILNTDAGTRYVTGARLACDSIGTSKTAYTGAGLAALTFSVGTSSTANANTIGATATVLNAVTVPTSTSMYSFASTTSNVSGANPAATLWHAGEYMTFQFNATNTAACTVGVDYIGS